MLFLIVPNDTAKGLYTQWIKQDTSTNGHNARVATINEYFENPTEYGSDADGYLFINIGTSTTGNPLPANYSFVETTSGTSTKKDYCLSVDDTFGKPISRKYFVRAKEYNKDTIEDVVNIGLGITTRIKPMPQLRPATPPAPPPPPTPPPSPPRITRGKICVPSKFTQIQLIAVPQKQKVCTIGKFTAITEIVKSPEPPKPKVCTIGRFIPITPPTPKVYTTSTCTIGTYTAND